MWFRRKPKNRRLGREYILDVKLRSSQVRAARLRMAALALGVVFATVLGAFVLWETSRWALDRLVYKNKAFEIKSIDVQTDGIIAVEQLRRWTGVRIGDNLLALDLARVKRDLEMISLVESTSVERLLPHTLRLRIVEREPLAQLVVLRPRPSSGIERAVFQVDADGYVIVPLDSRQRGAAPAVSDEQLPVIAGQNPGEVQAGRRLESPSAQAALRFLAAFDRSPMAGLVDLKRVDVCSPDVLVVTTGQGSEITFGLADHDRQLRRWQAIYAEGMKYSKAVAKLDLAVTNCIPVTWLEASSVPAPNPKPPKIPRKKHV